MGDKTEVSRLRASRRGTQTGERRKEREIEGRRRGKETREIEVFLACTKFRDSPTVPMGKCLSGAQRRWQEAEDRRKEKLNNTVFQDGAAQRSSERRAPGAQRKVPRASLSRQVMEMMGGGAGRLKEPRLSGTEASKDQQAGEGNQEPGRGKKLRKGQGERAHWLEMAKASGGAAGGWCEGS